MLYNEYFIISFSYEQESHGILSLLDEPHVQCDAAFLTRVEQCWAGHSHCLAADPTLPPNSFQYANIPYHTISYTSLLFTFLEFDITLAQLHIMLKVSLRRITMYFTENYRG